MVTETQGSIDASMQEHLSQNVHCHWMTGTEVGLGCVRVGLSPNGLPASRFRDKWQIWDGKRKTCFSPSRVVTFLPVQFFFVRRGQIVTFFGKNVTKKRHKFKKNHFVCESVTFFPEMWKMWRVTFFVTEKSDKCDVTRRNVGRCFNSGGWHFCQIIDVENPSNGLDIL